LYPGKVSELFWIFPLFTFLSWEYDRTTPTAEGTCGGISVTYSRFLPEMFRNHFHEITA